MLKLKQRYNKISKNPKREVNTILLKEMLPKAILAAVTESRMRRRGTAVQSFKALAGSSEAATVAAAEPPRMAVLATASFR